jgi:uncharacterized protein (DUF2267 family)
LLSESISAEERIMTQDELLEEVAGHAGLHSVAEAERALSAVLGVLGARLSHSESLALADELPPGVGEPLRAARFERAFDLEELYARVARAEQVTTGFAVEHTLSVCQAVAEVVSGAALERIRRALPPPMAALFTPREVAEPPVVEHVAPPAPTLAQGRPGSRHPLSEANAERAHSESIVRSDNPHADTKLSSSHGLTQEREHESLSTGKPGPSRPLSERRR